jgi:hypothetical protein
MEPPTSILSRFDTTPAVEGSGTPCGPFFFFFFCAKPGSVHAIVGSPGIGKSWSLIYALQQALLFKNACVLFCFQKVGNAWVCIRNNGHIYVWKMEYPLFLKNDCVSYLFKNGNVLALLDPKESTEYEGASYNGGRRQLIFAASNNVRHFSSLLGKETGRAKRILNPFSDNEIRAALPFVVDRKTDMERYTDVIMDRAKVVGNLLRYLIDEAKFEDRKIDQKKFIENVAGRRIDLESILSWNGMSEKKGHVPGTIYVVSIRETNFGDDNPVNVGYDGDLIKDYWDMAISPISPMIKGEVIKEWRAQILSYFNKFGARDHSKMGLTVEDLFWEDLKKGVIMKCWKISYGNKDRDFELFNTASGAFYKFDIHDEEDSFANARQDLLPFTTITNATIRDLATKVFLAETRTVCRMLECGKSLDMAGNGKNVFQVKVNAYRLKSRCLDLLRFVGRLGRRRRSGVHTWPFGRSGARSSGGVQR